MLDLPDAEDSVDEKLVSDIHEYGWHCVRVAEENHPEHAEQNAALGPHPVYDATFVYSVGLWLTRDHAELILVGRWQQAHGVLASVVSLIDEGAHFAPGDTSDGVVEGYTACFRAISDERREELLTYASWANRHQPFEALQLVLPDAAGVWPWDEGYAAYPQPLLG
jgi:hypothetical protein